MGKLRILIADDESLHNMGLRAQLESLGHDVVGEASSGQEAVEMACKLKPDLAILDIRMPDVEGIEAASRISSQMPMPIILITAYSEVALAERAVEAGVFAYLIKPVSEADLLPAILLAMARFKEFQMLQQDIKDLREALETRKVVEQAKGILMQRRGFAEAEAFRILQLQSQKENKKLIEIARAVILAEKLL
ncbi:MAG: response regulator [Dehalococcoidales bacterium]|nr:response regulator [Dehalococcoidales bacterium]